MEMARVEEEPDLPIKVPAIELVDVASDEGVVAPLSLKTSNSVQNEGYASGEDEENSDEDGWESESMFEEALEGIRDEQLLHPGGTSQDSAPAKDSHGLQNSKHAHSKKHWLSENDSMISARMGSSKRPFPQELSRLRSYALLLVSCPLRFWKAVPILHITSFWAWASRGRCTSG